MIGRLAKGEFNAMKLFFAGAATLLAATVAFAQPATESKTIGGKTISVKYSSPKVRGREGKLFGKDGVIGQDPTYPVWRAGANSARTRANSSTGSVR